MTKRFGKKWLVFIFVLLSLVAWAGFYINSESYLASQHNVMSLGEWKKISAEELADALEKGEFNPDQLILEKIYRGRGFLISPAIISAAYLKQGEHLRLLLDYGAQIDLTEIFGGHSALHYAAWGGQVEMMEILLKYGSQVDYASKKTGVTALHMAAAGGHKDAMEVLLKAGANPNIISEKHTTPLLFLDSNKLDYTKNLTDEQLKEMILLLVDGGADINFVNSDGRGLVGIFIRECRTGLIEFFIDKGLKVKGALFFKDEEGFLSFIPISPLSFAALVYPGAMPILLEAGADPNYISLMAPDITLLKVAIISANPTLAIQILIDAKADVNQDIGGTALQYAKWRADGEFYDMYSSLVETAKEEMPKSCVVAEKHIYAQSMEEWQQKGQEAVDMLLANGAKDDGSILIADARKSMAIVFSTF